MFQPTLNQIALSVIDLRRTERWFREGLGFLAAGGSALMMSGPLAAKIQGLPKAASTCWWLVGRNSWFQLELFQFRRPIAKLMPADFRPCDIGYSRIGVHVLDFDATLASLAKLNSTPLTKPVGEPGHRRACVRSPDGLYVEIMEDDPLIQRQQDSQASARQCNAAIRSVTLSTPDLAASVAYLSAISGTQPQDIYLHSDEHEAIWGLTDAKCQRAVFETGDTLVEVVQYLNPVGEPWPKDYRICDQGIVNIAFGARNKRDHSEIFQRAEDFGVRPNSRPIHLPGAGVVYVNDSLGFSVEILWTTPGKSDATWGFEPLPLHKRPQADNQHVQASVRIDAPAERVWQVLNDQNAMSHWIGFVRVERIRDGNPEADGYGSERHMQGQPGTVVEQVTGIEFIQCIRYRVIKGSPFIFHNGEIRLRDCGDQTEVEWSIRFRSKIPLLGGLLRRFMHRLLRKMLQQGLKPYAEQSW